MIHVLTLLALLGHATSQEPSTARPMDMVEKMTACGFAQVAAAYSDELQSDIFTVGDASATDEKLECAARLVENSGYLIEFPPDVQPRFYKLQARLLGSKLERQAREYLASRGLLQQVSKFSESGLSAAEFAGRLEVICGYEPNSVFRSQFGPHVIDLRLQAGEPFDAKSLEGLRCIVSAATVAEFEIGFVGNEAVKSVP